MAIIDKNNLPKISELIKGRVYKINSRNLSYGVYNENGRMQVAGLSKLVKKHQDHPVVKALIKKAFEDFYTTALFPISKNGEVSLVGSIAFYFKEELESVLNKKGYSIQKIIPSADKELLTYHKTFNFCP